MAFKEKTDVPNRPVMAPSKVNESIVAKIVKKTIAF